MRAHHQFYEGPIGVSGVGLGVPGGARDVFADDTVEAILAGESFISSIPDPLRAAMVEKKIVRLVKDSASFEAVDDPSQVIKLAGRLGRFDPAGDFGIDAKLLSGLDTASQLAICAGFEALRDAHIPLVRQTIQARNGKAIGGAWSLPETLQPDTGVVFASAFPGYDSLIEQVSHHIASLTRRRDREEVLTSFHRWTDELPPGGPRDTLSAWLVERGSSLLSDEAPYAFSRDFLFKILSMGHSQFAQIVRAKGPNTQVNAACASTAQAVGIAEDWLRTRRCRRVIVLSADNASSDRLLPWIGSGFLAAGAASTEARVEAAALPFGAGRHGLIIGAAASALVLETESAWRERGVEPTATVLGSEFRNSAFHGSRLDVHHIATTLDAFIARMESSYGISREAIARDGMFVSHETYTPARGGSAEAELRALETTFGPKGQGILIVNTKGFTGHPMGAGVEEAVAIKAIEKAQVPPIYNIDRIDPALAGFNFSRGEARRPQFALRLGAGFGSQLAFVLFAAHRPEARVVLEAHRAWLAALGGDEASLFLDGRVLKIKGAEARTQTRSPAKAEGAPSMSDELGFNPWSA